MSVACFDQLEGILEFANPFRALTPRGLRTPRTPRTPRETPRGEAPKTPRGEAEADGAVVVPPTLVCRAKGDGVPLGLLCRVSRRGELLMLGCHRTGKLTGVRMLKNAEVEVPNPGVIEINARNAPSLVLRCDTAQEADYWAEDFKGCPTQPSTPRGATTPRVGGSTVGTPRVERTSATAQPRQSDFAGLSPWTAGGALDAPSCILGGRHRSKESASTCSGVATTRSTAASRRRRSNRLYKEKESAPETTNSEEENSSDLEGWVEAQTARSSRLMQLFEKEHRRMNATADKLADRRQLIERESRCIDALEAAEHEHQEGLDKLHEVVAQLSSRCRKADDGPQYFYIGDSEVETQTVSPASTAGQITPAQNKLPAGLPQLNLNACRENIERSVASAEDVWEERRRVLQEQAQSREARRAELPAAQDSAIRKTPLMSPRRMAGSGRKRQSSGGSQSLREAHGMILRQLSPPKEQALPGETEDFGEVLSRESSKLSDEVPLSLDPSASQLEMLQEPEPTAEEPLEAVEDPEPTAADPLAAAEDPEPSAEEPLAAAEEIDTAADEPPVEAWPPQAVASDLQAAEEAPTAAEEPPSAEPAAVVEKAPRSATEDSAEEHLTLMGESSNAGSWSRMVSEEEDVPTDGTLKIAVGAVDLDALDKGFVRHSSTEDADAKASAWVSNKSFPKPLGGEAGEERTLQQTSSKELLDPCEGSAEPGTIAWVIPEPMPEEPVEDSELTRALSKRRQQVENSHCEFTKEGLNSRADMSWKQSAKASTGSIGVFTKEGIHSPADIPRSSPRYSKFRTSSK